MMFHQLYVIESSYNNYKEEDRSPGNNNGKTDEQKTLVVWTPEEDAPREMARGSKEVEPFEKYRERGKETAVQGLREGD